MTGFAFGWAIVLALWCAWEWKLFTDPMFRRYWYMKIDHYVYKILEKYRKYRDKIKTILTKHGIS